MCLEVKSKNLTPFLLVERVCLILSVETEVTRGKQMLLGSCLDLLQHRTFAGLKQREADFLSGVRNDRLSVALRCCGQGHPSRMQVLSHRALCDPEIASVNVCEQGSCLFYITSIFLSCSFAIVMWQMGLMECSIPRENGAKKGFIESPRVVEVPNYT